MFWRLDAERAHNLALAVLRTGLVRVQPPTDPRLSMELFGRRLPHPVGLAAGFDKNGIALRGLQRLGFAFVEVGTVTPRPQPGNPKPRLFRLPEDLALINRLGFNNAGAETVASNLERRPGDLVVGVNLGKNKDTTEGDAPNDYVAVWRRLAPHADYGVVNISSPNTPGLRDLQSPTFLRNLIPRLLEIENKPILVKLSPDEEDGALIDLVGVALEAGAAGAILTNTTLARTNLQSPNAKETGGLSGAPLRQRATEALRAVRAAHPRATLVGVGGIFTGKDLFERLRAGADVVQIYTAFVYRGPQVVKRILEEFQGEMRRQGVSSIDELRSS